ncbi:SRPBCC family protein [Pseudactinotalea sp.]|uniref:SRPBCC family protein n=1 Tax=Pseudactinotalea sp. TaxID=1926260 RepID=UPI003B3ADAD4
MYRLSSTWHLPASPEQVWAAVERVEGWPRWWVGMLAATTVRQAGPDGLGQRVHLVVGSPLGHRLGFGVEIVEADPPHRASARVVGDLRGRGAWSVAPAISGCVATILWHVTPARPLLRSPLLRRPATWAHGRVMAAGERGLVTHLTRSDS